MTQSKNPILFYSVFFCIKFLGSDVISIIVLSNYFHHPQSFTRWEIQATNLIIWNTLKPLLYRYPRYRVRKKLSYSSVYEMVIRT